MERAVHLDRKAWKLLALCAAVAAALIGFWRYLAPAVELVAGGAVIAFLLAPPCDKLAALVKRPVAAAITVVGTLALMLGLLLLLAPYLTRQFSELIAAVPASVEALRGTLDSLILWLREKGIAAARLPNIDWGALTGGLSGVLGGAVGFFSSVASAVSSFALMIVMAYFFLSDRDRLLLRLEMLIPQGARRIAVKMAGAVKRELMLYLRGQAMICLMVGALAAVALLIVGVPSAPVLGALIGAFNLIPYFGPLIGGIPVVIFAFGGGMRRVLFAIIALVAVQQADGAYISPRVMGSLTGVSPVAVLVAITIGSGMAGVAGMLFALPVLLILRISLRVWAGRNERN